MAELKQATVPDIGNYTNVPVIEVLVRPGDAVAKDQGLVTLESDKATMEVPAPFAGVVKEVKVKLGDEVSEGAIVAVIETGQTATNIEPEAPKISPLPPAGEVATQIVAGEGGTAKVQPPSAPPTLQPSPASG